MLFFISIFLIVLVILIGEKLLVELFLEIEFSLEIFL